MDETKQNTLLSLIDRDSLTVGVEIPEEIVVQERKIPLSEMVFDICSEGKTPDKFDMSVDEIKVQLRRERNNLVEEIEEGSITYQKGEENLEKIKSVERALSVLKNSGQDVSIEDEIKRNEAMRAKKWKNFLDKIKMDNTGKR